MQSWLGFVDDAGNFALDNREGFLAYARKFAGREVVVTIKRKPPTRSCQQLRYLRGVVVPDIAQACGYSDPDDYESVYEGLMWKFARLPDGPFGEPRRKSMTLDETGMPPDERNSLIDQIVMYAETTIPGCRIRRPEEVELDRVADQEWT